MAVFLDVTYILVDSYRHLGETCCFHLHGRIVSWDWKKKCRRTLENGPLKGQHFFKLFLYLFVCSEPQAWLSLSLYVYDFLMLFIILPWRWKQQIPPKHRYVSNKSHRITSQETVIFTVKLLSEMFLVMFSVHIRFPAVQGSSLFHGVQTESGARPVSYPMGTGGSFPWG
jgi:hypothetical protein